MRFFRLVDKDYLFGVDGGGVWNELPGEREPGAVQFYKGGKGVRSTIAPGVLLVSGERNDGWCGWAGGEFEDGVAG